MPAFPNQNIETSRGAPDERVGVDLDMAILIFRWRERCRLLECTVSARENEVAGLINQQYRRNDRWAQRYWVRRSARFATGLKNEAKRRARERHGRIWQSGVQRRGAGEATSEDVYQALRRTITRGEPLDPSVADAVASALKDWAIENGATHYTHWFQPLTGITAEKHDSFLAPVTERQGGRRVLRQGAGQGRARCIELPVGRHALHVRGARIHGVGSHQPAVAARQRQRDRRSSFRRRS